MANNEPVTGEPTAAELRRLVRQAPGTAGRNEAIAALAAQNPRGLNRYLTDLALEDDLDQATRVKAVAALGRRASPTSLSGLRAAVDVADEVVVQRAVETLGKVGQPEDLELLKQIRTGNRVTQRVLRSAKEFVSYRHGIGQYRHDVPRRTYGAGGADATEIRTVRLTGRVAEGLEDVALPGVSVASKGAQRLVCGSNEYVLAVTADNAGEAMLDIRSRQALPAVILQMGLETNEFEVAYYLMTDPASKGKAHVFGVRGSGRVALYGMASIEGSAVEFEVKATENPLEPPVTVSGAYNTTTGALRFEMAMSQPRLAAAQLRKRKSPKLEVGPV